MIMITIITMTVTMNTGQNYNSFISYKMTVYLPYTVKSLY